MNPRWRKFIIEGDRPLTCLPELAKLVGTEKAIILQQLHWLSLNDRNGKLLKDGHRWIYNTYDEWVEEHFVWLKSRTIMRYFTDLEKPSPDRPCPWILSCQPEGGISRRKYYRLNYHDWQIGKPHPINGFSYEKKI